MLCTSEKSTMKDIVPFQHFVAVHIQMEQSTSGFSLDPSLPPRHMLTCSTYLFFKATYQFRRWVKCKNLCVHKPIQTHFCFSPLLQDSLFLVCKEKSKTAFPVSPSLLPPWSWKTNCYGWAVFFSCFPLSNFPELRGMEGHQGIKAPIRWQIMWGTTSESPKTKPVSCHLYHTC